MGHDLKRQARALVSALELPRVLFDYSVAWGPNYRAIFAGDGLRIEPVTSVLDASRQSGRVLLCGRAGSGKSVILRQLAKRASDAGSLVVLIDLSRWVSVDTGDLSQRMTDPSSCMNLLVSRFSGLDATLLDLDMISPGESKIVLIDGINEVPVATGNLVLRAVDDVVTRLINSCVIVADRLARRQISEDRWRLARVEPLSQASVDKAYGKANRKRGAGPASLLDWPFFLARALDDDRSSGSGTEALHQFFEGRVRLSGQEMRTVGAAAYEAYVRWSSRTFPSAFFADSVGNDTVRKLIDAGALEITGTTAHFAHHLHHDFLAAMHVATQVDLWGYAGFNALSFQGSAFDSIALAFAQVPRESKPDFVRKVYDWNPYAISFALAEEEYRQQGDIDGELEGVVLSMLAERRWDPIIPTVERSNDALSLFPRRKSAPFLETGSLHALVAYVSQLASNIPWFNEWQSFFRIESAEAVTDEVLARLADPDSIVGWTLANVLKRFRLDPERLARIVTLAEDARPEVRWRAVHVLGASPAEGTAIVALRLLDHDPDTWVRYGALRSLVEMAAFGDTATRTRILSGLVDRRSRIVAVPRLRDELVRAMRVRHERTSGEWLTSALAVLSAYLESSSTVEDVDYWARAIRQLRADDTRRES